MDKNYSFNQTYRLSDTVLKNVSYVKDLGIIIDSGLSFEYPMESIIDKVKRTTGFLKKFTKLLVKIASFRTLYSACIYFACNINLLLGDLEFMACISYR